MSAFDLIAGVLLVASALAAVTLKNAVHAGLALVGNFLVLAMVYFALEAQFLGWIQIIVYAGAVMVLFLFVIMLLYDAKADVGVDRLPWMRPVGAALAAVFFLALAYAFSGVGPVNPLADVKLAGGLPGPLGKLLYGSWLYVVLLIAVLLFAATVAAVVLVQPQTRKARVKPQVAERDRELEEVGK
ncbi:NADH-quinone oxidoreductase subunit J family protein [Oceanithermus sp.]